MVDQQAQSRFLRRADIKDAWSNVLRKKEAFLQGWSVVKKFIAKLGFSEEQYQLDDGSGLSQKRTN